MEGEPTEVPQGARVVEADSIETIERAQEIKTALKDYFGNRRASLGDLRRLIHRLIQ